MICYRDMTFCRGDGCVKFTDCPRALTDEVAQKAETFGLPISQFMQPSELKCYVKSKEKGATDE